MATVLGVGEQAELQIRALRFVRDFEELVVWALGFRTLLPFRARARRQICAAIAPSGAVSV
jgi:ornithine cyclodeaminase/alanine dehydrogenase-like protein (mu-crystallin family)